MKSRVLYVSKNKKESAKQIAQAISLGAKIACDPVEKHTRVTDVDILFLGCEMFFGKIRGELRKLAMNIDPSQVRQVIVFSVGSSPDKTGLAEIKAILEPKGINVSETEFFCKDKVTDQVIKDAQIFGKTSISKAGSGA